MKKTLITSALLYANGPAHFGHIAGAYLPADIYARYRRLQGDRVLFLSGSDEYGMPITLSAEKAGKTPKEHVDLYHNLNEALFHKLSFSFDHYSRTTWKGHEETVLAFFQDLKKNGFLMEKEELHLYSEKEGKFLADRYVVGTCPRCGFTEARGDECTSCGANYESLDLKNPRSKMTGSPLSLKKSRHCYLRFDQFKEPLKKWIAEKHWKENVRNFSEKYIEDLKPRAITRDATWGIPITLDDGSKKVFYVWFDAPIGYISAAKDWSQKQGSPDLWKDFWLDPNTSFVQFIGKDNIPFHSVFFPAMVMGQNAPYKLVDDLPANEFLQLEGKKFSKSDGHSIDLEQFFTKYSADQARYYLAANAPETADADFIWKDFQTSSNADLLGKFGNFVHRVFVFAKRYGDATLPKGSSTAFSHLGEGGKEFMNNLRSCWETIGQSYDQFQVRKACSCLMKMASLGNAFFNANAPWKLVKEGNVSAVNEVLFACFFCMKLLAVAAFPIIPNTSSRLWKMLGFSRPIEQQLWENTLEEELPFGTVLEDPEVLFEKIEDESIEYEEKMLASSVENAPVPGKETIEFDQFSALDLRVAKIISAEKVKKSRKLLCIQVDLGFAQRQVVSGLAERFSPEELLGKHVLFLANLAPRKIMGILSEGMILAAGEKEALEIPTVEKASAGSVVS